MFYTYLTKIIMLTIYKDSSKFCKLNLVLIRYMKEKRACRTYNGMQ